MKNRILYLIPLLVSLSWTNDSKADQSGLYKTIFYHNDSKFYNVGEITLTVIQAGEKPVFAGTVKIYFGPKTSNEFLIYDFAFEQCYLLFGKNTLTCKNEKNDVSVVGTINEVDSTFKGFWFSKLVGQVGAFESSKKEEPKPPADAVLVNPISGYYEGPFVNTNPQFLGLIKDISLTLVTTQDISGPEPKIVITGSIRIYPNGIGGLYYPLKVKDAQFNFYNRFLTIATEPSEGVPGFTFRGYASNDGLYASTIIVDGYGKVGTVELKLAQ